MSGHAWCFPPRILGILLLNAMFLAAACAPVGQRAPLPAPLPLTTGGTPVPGHGIGLGIGIGDGLQGQELLRKELHFFTLTGGVADVGSLGYSFYSGHDQDVDEEPTVHVVAGKVRIGSFFGRTSTAVHASYSQTDRAEFDESFTPVQDEALVVWELAVPTEFLLSALHETTQVSVYIGPRIMYEDYSDALVPADDLSDVIPAILAGIHFRYHSVHLFGEGNLVFRPETTYRGTTFDGGTILLPIAGIIGHIGSPFRWDR